MEALFLKLVNLSITATYLALAVILLRLIFKKAPKWISCVLWGLVAVRLIFPFNIESVLSLVPSSEPIPQNIINTATPHIYSGFSVIDNTVNPILSSQFTPAVGDSVNPTQVLTFALSRVWLVGLCAMVVYAFISWLLLKRKVRTSTIMEGNVRQSEFVDSPFVLGIIKPVIYIPYQISSDDFSYVIAHEQAHIKRRDNWWKPFGFLLLSIYWFNPVMWIAYILLCRDIEAACDERVIHDMKKEELQAYSTALLNCSVHRRRIAACPLAFGEVGVKERIKTVMNYKKPAFWIIVVAVVACIVAAVCFLTSPQKDIDTPNNTALIATVTEIHSDGQSMNVIGYYDNQEYSVPLKNMEPSPEPEVGDIVQIIYSGGLLETYPLQFERVLKISVIDNFSEQNPNITLEQAISKAVLLQNKGKYLEREFACESHIILYCETESNNRIDTVTVYASVLYQEYDLTDGKISAYGGSHVPTALTFNVDENGNYTLTEYWVPRDGSYYATDIRNKFPNSVAEDAIDTQRTILPLMQSCYAQAVEYGKLDTDRIAEELLQVICSSPAQYSNPSQYIDEHSKEYRELLYYGDCTLQYIYKEFLSSACTDLRGSIMWKLMEDLAPDLQIKPEAETGREYFDAILNYTEQMRDENGEEWLHSNIPHGWLLLYLRDSAY